MLLNCWGTPESDLILADDENDQDLGTLLEKKRISLQAFLEYDRWKK